MFNNVSYQLKYRLRRLVRFTPIYQKAVKSVLLSKTQEEKEALFWDMLKYAVKHVPYYSKYAIFLKEGYTILDIPLLHKEDLTETEAEFVSDEFRTATLLKVSTGGTTGTSTNIYTSWKDEIRTTAYTDVLFASKELPKPIICTIREHDLQQGEYYRFFGNRLMFSPSNLNTDSLDLHVQLLRKYKINILHCYPSSLLVLCKLLHAAKITLEVEEIVVSSEICTPEVFQMAKKVFPNALFVNFYGQTENVARGISLNGAPFQFSSQCLVEFIDTGERRGEHIVANIVGTNLEKKSMPLIRFLTGDQAILDKDGNVLEILGRTSEYLIDKGGNPIPCIVTNRPETLKNVLLAQYYQEVEGIFEYRVMVNEDFSESDVQAILEDIRLNFGKVLSCEVKVVDTMEKTSRGKHKKLIQKLDLNKYL